MRVRNRLFLVHYFFTADLVIFVRVFQSSTNFSPRPEIINQILVTEMEYPLLSLVFAKAHAQIFSLLDLNDILKLSTCSRFSANLGIDSATVHTLLKVDKRASHLGNFSLRFPEELTTGLLRRILNRVNSGVEATISIDQKSGRIILDIGSAFNNKDAFLASEVQPVSDDEAADAEENQEIFKHLEICSYDEYDDFNPRHPKPRDKAHRRGDSYFNSDIDMVVNELYSGTGASPFNLANIASSAVRDLDEPKPKAGAGAGGDLKSRLLAKKAAAAAASSGSGPLVSPPIPAPRASSPGCITRLPYQLRASKELNVDSDEDN